MLACMKARASFGSIERSLALACAGALPLVARGSRVLVACSGGADSVALAAAFARVASLRPRLGLRVSLGHIDHGLRPESALEAEAVRTLAEQLGVPFFLERLEGLDAAVAQEGLEAAAREARYAALLRLAAAAEAQVIATAHTRSDQAETLLLRLARGAGPGALSGVRVSRPLGALRLVRPLLLAISRADTEAYCALHGLGFSRDPHNVDPARARARIRLELPRLAAQLNPRLEEALAGTAALLADEDALLTDLAGQALLEARVERGLSASLLLRLHPALLRRCLLAAARANGARPERDHLRQIQSLLVKGAGAVDLPRGRAVLESGALHFFGATVGPHADPGTSKAPPAAPLSEVAVPGPGRYARGSALLEVSVGEEGCVMQPANKIDSMRAPFPWTLRAPLPGDRFRPGGGHEKKLSRLLIDARIPRSIRAGLALLADSSGTLFYVEGLRPGDASRGSLRAPVLLRFRRDARELNRSAEGLDRVGRATPPRATMPPHRPDEEPR